MSKKPNPRSIARATPSTDGGRSIAFRSPFASPFARLSRTGRSPFARLSRTGRSPPPSPSSPSTREIAARVVDGVAGDDDAAVDARGVDGRSTRRRRRVDGDAARAMGGGSTARGRRSSARATGVDDDVRVESTLASERARGDGDETTERA